MIKIRPYLESDSETVGKLVADTYNQYNLTFLPLEERALYLGPFQFARSPERMHREEIAKVLRAPLVLVAENEQGEIVGVLRGSKDRLHSLFVRGDHHRMGIGRLLMQHFEQECLHLGSQKITLASSIYAIPFYQSLGYKKSTGLRAGWSFEGRDLKWQPMKKVLISAELKN